MKRIFGVVIALLLVAFVATPAFAQSSRGDHVCFGGVTVVSSEETPNSVVLFGCGARIQAGAQIRRDVVSFGSEVVLEENTHVANDVVIFGGDLTLAGRVDEDIVLMGGDMILQPTAVVNGDVHLLGGKFDRKEGAVVRGQIQRNQNVITPSVRAGSFPFNRYNDWGFWGGMIGGFFQNLFATLSLAALGALILVFLPTQLNQVAQVAQKSAAPSLGVGCLTWLIVPPLMILFVITCLGIPVSLALGIAFVAAGVLGWIAIALIVGERLLVALKAKNLAPLLSMVVGLAVLWIVSSLPVLGGLIWLFIVALAMGAVVLTRFGTRPYPSLVPAPVAPSTVTTPLPALAPSAPASVETPSATPPAAEDAASPKD